MTEITDLSPTDASNTSITGQSLVGNVANMSAMDNTLQAILGAIGRLTDQGTIASATMTDIGAQPESYLTVSGTTTITGLGTIREGTIRFLKFDGALTLTHNATSLILPGASNITTTAGDVAALVSEGSGNWRCLSYLPSAPILNTLNGQYKFPASPNLSTNANTLDAYVEGTFTPVVADALTGGNSASGTFNGRYTRVGNLVIMFMQLVNVNTTGMTGANDLFIRFTAAGLTPISGFDFPGAITMNNVGASGVFVVPEYAGTTAYKLQNIRSGNSSLPTVVSDISSGTSDISITVSFAV